MDEQQTYSTVESDGFTISSSGETQEAMQAALSIEPAVEVETTEPETEKPAAERDEAGRFKAKSVEEEVVKPKPRENPRARVEQATGQAAEAKRLRESAEKERDEARAESARYRAELETLRTPREVPKPQAAVAADEPNPGDLTKYPNGEFDRQYLRDIARYEAKQELQQERAREEQAARVRQQQDYKTRVETDYSDRLAKFRAETPDFDQRLNPQTPFNPAHLPHFMTLEDAPQILLYLSDHQDDAQRLAALHPIQAVREFGKISARLEAASTRGPAPIVPSKASAPIVPLGGGSSATPDDGSDDESFDTFFKRENAKLSKAGRR